MTTKAFININHYEPSLHVIEDGNFQKLCYLPAQVEAIEEGSYHHPMISGDNVREFVQAIVNAAYDAGIYPEKLIDTSSELNATKRHLEDMRSLVFKKGD